MTTMPDKTVNDYKQRALATIRELSESGIDDLAETLRPYRIRHVENMIEALRAYILAPDTPDSERAVARRAVEEIEKQLHRIGRQ